LRKVGEKMLKGMKIVLKGRKSGAKAGKKALKSMPEGMKKTIFFATFFCLWR
jgi:hypothetical protein